MAGVSYFGEVVQQSSRAFWNDEDSDDEIDAGTDVKLELTKCCEEGKSDFTLILADGQVANEFVKFFIVNAKEDQIAKIHGSDDDRSKMSGATLLRLSESTLLCISCSVPVEQSNHLTTLLSPWLKAGSRIIILASAVSADYRCYESDLPPSFLRCLSTDAWKECVKAPLLEIPNIISGVPASILTFCQVENIPAVLYVCYSESLQIDSRNIQPFFELFQSSRELNSLIKSNVDVTKYTHSSTITNSNMYL